MKWLLLMVIASVDGELSVEIVSKHETMAQCYFASTLIDFEERKPVNKDLLCFQTEYEVK